jgi:hypothetical protein
MQPSTISLLLTACAVLTACNSKELTRSNAATIIKQNLGFPQDVTVRFSLGQVNVGQNPFERFALAPSADTNG